MFDRNDMIVSEVSTEKKKWRKKRNQFYQRKKNKIIQLREGWGVCLFFFMLASNLTFPLLWPSFMGSTLVYTTICSFPRSLQFAIQYSLETNIVL